MTARRPQTRLQKLVGRFLADEFERRGITPIAGAHPAPDDIIITNSTTPGVTGVEWHGVATVASAELASGTGTAHDASVPSIQPTAEVATGTGTAHDATAKVPTAYQTFVLSKSPDSYWPLQDASGNFEDVASTYDATAGGTPSYQQTGPTINSEAQDAIDFDDANPDYGAAAEGYDDGAHTTMTISAWFKIDASTQTEHFLSAQTGASTKSWGLRLDGSGFPYMYTYQTDGSSVHGFPGSANALDDGSWHHIVGWVDSSGNVHIDVDGGTYTGDDNSPTGTWNGAATSGLSFGAYTTAGDTPSDVTLAHVAFWKSDVGATTRTALYTGTDGGTTADAELASGTGTASDAVPEIQPVGEVATGTGAASNAVPEVQPVAGVATGTGTAHQASGTDVDPTAEAATGTGTASDAGPQVAPFAGQATGTGTAEDATPELAPTAGAATGTGTAETAATTIVATSGIATGTGTAHDGTVDTTTSTIADAELASGTGVASDAVPEVQPGGEVASGTGTASDAVPAIQPVAEAGTGTGTAHDASAALGPTAGVASGTGAAYDVPTLAIAPTAETATGTGTASPALADMDGVAEHPPGTGAAHAASAAVGPTAGVATGTGTSHEADALTGSQTIAQAEVASGTGTASDAVPEVQPVSEAATAIGTAWGAITWLAPIAEAASGTGAAFDASVQIQTRPQVATGTGTAYDGTVDTGTTANAENASGTGTAHDAAVAIAPTAQAASGTGQADQASGWTPAAAGGGRRGEWRAAPFQPSTEASSGHARGSGAAHDARVRITEPDEALIEALAIGDLSYVLIGDTRS
jgi:hypothetical protein